MNGIRVFLFGTPMLEYYGLGVEVDTRKAIALLAYLAVSGKRHSRDALAAFLWPDNDQVHARSALRRTLSVLQKALPGNYLDISRENIAILPGESLWVDVLEFRRLIASQKTRGYPPESVDHAGIELLIQAVELYRGDFLAGFTLRDSAGFDEWQFFESDNLKQELSGALALLTANAIAYQNFSGALTYGQRWLALDPLREDVHRQLMLIYAWTGQRNAALRQYRECIRILDQELGVPPLEETSSLYQAILENHLPEPPRAASDYVGANQQNRTPDRVSPQDSAAQPGPVSFNLVSDSGYPMVGRSRESEMLEQAYQVQAKNGHLALIEGEPGIGKTRLAEALLASTSARGAVIARARCYSGEGNLAFGPIIAALTSILGLPESAARLQDAPAMLVSEAARLVPELESSYPNLPTPAALSGPGAQTRFFEGLRQVFITLLAGPHPGILFIDDLNLADSASFDFLTYLIRRLDSSQLFILATWSEPVTLGNLNPTIADAQRSGWITRIHLKRLSAADIGELVRIGLPNQFQTPSDLEDRLYRHSEGLPFFAVEYLSSIKPLLATTSAAGAGQGAMVSQDWMLPLAVREALRVRMAAAGDTGGQVLSTAAVIGRSFDFDTLLDASGRNENETIASLEKLLALNLIGEEQISASGGITYDFTHDQLRRLVYDETSLIRRRLIHRRVADALVTQMRRRTEQTSLPNLIAQHYHLAGQEEQAAEYYKLAAANARRIFANQEALANYNAALSSGHLAVGEIHEAIGDLLTLMADYSAALNSYETAASFPNADPRLDHKIGALYHRQGEWELAICHYQLAVESEMDTSAAFRSQVFADWSLAAQRQEQPEQAMQLAEYSLELAKESGDPTALACAHNILGILSRRANLKAEANEHLEASLNYARQLHDPAMLAASLNNLAYWHQESGNISLAIDTTQEALQVLRRLGDRHREAALLNHLADLYHLSGQEDLAMQHLKAAVMIFSEVGASAGELQPEIWKLTEW